MEAPFQRAMAEFKAGRVAEALRFADEAAALDPDNLEVLLFTGVLNARLGRHIEAVSLLKEVIIGDSRQFVAAYWLSIACQKLGRLSDAREYARMAVSINPRDPLAHERLAYCFMAAYEHESAETCFLTCLRAQPSNAVFVGGLGLALMGQGKVGEARQLFERAVQLEPKSATSFLHLARLLTEEQEAEDALVAARRAVELRPDWDEAIHALITALLQAGQSDEAARLLDGLVSPGATSARTLVFLGETRQSLGDSGGAGKAFEQALDLNPTEPGAWFGLVRSRRLGPDDLQLIDRMEEALKVTGLAPEAETNLRYALGKASEDLGRYDEAMGHFDEANRLARLLKYGKAPFDPAQSTANDASDLCMFTSEFLAKHRLVGSPDDRPIFVVGMMRSGTTLTEQVLASHPGIGGAGETKYWLMNRRRAFESSPPHLLTGMLKPLAEEYCALLMSRAPGKRFVVDKMPENYALLPLIYLALPNARIIHIKRHPVDTCLSIWSTPNAARIDWAHDKENIVFAYERYLRLMSAWRSVLPEGAMLEIQYEDLAAEPEPVIRRLLEFLAVEFDEACLRPQDRQGSVVTPSAWQVRQPFNTRSVGRWQRYEPWLGLFSNLFTHISSDS